MGDTSEFSDTSQVIAEELTKQVKTEDIGTIVNAQREMLMRYEKTNEMLLYFNMLSTSCFEKTSKDIKQHTLMLGEMKRDLDSVFHRIRQMKSRLQKMHGAAFAACNVPFSVDSEDGDDGLTNEPINPVLKIVSCDDFVDITIPSGSALLREPQPAQTFRTDKQPVQPDISNDQPDISNDQPDISNDQPDISNDQPDFSNDQTGVSNHQTDQVRVVKNQVVQLDSYPHEPDTSGDVRLMKQLDGEILESHDPALSNPVGQNPVTETHSGGSISEVVQPKLDTRGNQTAGDTQTIQSASKNMDTQIKEWK